MRLNTTNWTICGNSKIGHYHVTRGGNNQDSVAYLVNTDPEIAIGVICDGCGEGEHSEVGAKLLSRFVVNSIQDLMLDVSSLPALMKLLFKSTVSFLRQQARLISGTEHSESIADVFRNYLSATILGFIINTSEDSGIIFGCGDGMWQSGTNDYLSGSVIDQDDCPHYIAYACIDNPEKFNIPDNVIPAGFRIHTKFTPRHIDRVMIATDGFRNHNRTKIQLCSEQHGWQLPAELDKDIWGKKGNFGLKKWLNTRSLQGYFEDDCGVIIAEKRFS